MYDCVCVCARARALVRVCACVCMCVRARELDRVSLGVYMLHPASWRVVFRGAQWDCVISNRTALAFLFARQQRTP